MTRALEGQLIMVNGFMNVYHKPGSISVPFCSINHGSAGIIIQLHIFEDPYTTRWAHVLFANGTSGWCIVHDTEIQ